MKLQVLGIDLGKTVLSFGWIGFNGQCGDSQAMFSHPTVGLYREFASAVDRHGGLQWSPLSGAGAARSKVMKCG